MDVRAQVLASLKRWGALRSPRVESALERAWKRVAGPSNPWSLGADAPWVSSAGTLALSARLSVLLAEALEVRPGLVVALPHPGPALLRVLVEGVGARVHDPLRDGAADRSLAISPVSRRVDLVDGGFSLDLTLEPYKEALVKRVWSDQQTAEIRLENYGLPIAESSGGAKARTIRQLLVLEAFCRRALRHEPVTQHDHLFLQAVESTWDPGAGRAPALSETARTRLAQSRTYFHLAYIHQFVGDVADAAALYRASLQTFATAEAHTFLGWTHGASGDYVRAIEECERAVELDPDFGNPYNDIGAYLLELGRPEEALPWLRRALEAARYEAPHFAYTNAGRGLLMLGNRDAAVEAFQQALRVEPKYKPARDYLSRLAGPNARGPPRSRG